MFFEHIPHLQYIWLVAASTIAGVMNAMAGGGSFISFPAMPTRNENSSVFQEAYPAPGTHVDVALFHTAEH